MNIEEIKLKLKEMDYNDLDDPFLKMYLDAIEINNLASEDLKRNGLNLYTKDGVKPNPSLSAYRVSAGIIERVGKALGISAHGRKATGQAPKEVLKTQDLFDL
jgi:phage terminase small subunit